MSINIARRLDGAIVLRRTGGHLADISLMALDAAGLRGQWTEHGMDFGTGRGANKQRMGYVIAPQPGLNQRELRQRIHDVLRSVHPRTELIMEPWFRGFVPSNPGMRHGEEPWT
jgi:hypothetical protein